MTNEQLLDRVKNILKKRGLSLYDLQKKTDEDILKESTFYSMFNKKSVARIEYISEISRALEMPLGELVDGDNTNNYLEPVQLEILEEFKDLDKEMIRRILPIVKGVIIAEKNRTFPK